MLKIISAPNPVLSQSAKQISKIDKSVLKLIGEMEQILLSAKDPVGVGLAAPQVGKSLRIFIAKPTEKANFLVAINPTIVNIYADQKQIDADRNQRESVLKSARIKSPALLEGCLSLPNIWGTVSRKKKITVKYQNLKGRIMTKTFENFVAVIAQHEIDHLDGILFPKKVLEQKGKLYKSHKNKKGEDEFEEIEI